MTLKCLATGSKANCYVLKRDNGEMLILDAGLPISEIKKGIGFDVANLKGAVITHSHKDHSLSADKLKDFTPVYKPYLGAKRQHTYMGDFEITSFDLPHSVENRGLVIRADGQRILYATDFEYIPYNLSGLLIDTMLIELNYQTENIDNDLDNHKSHVILGHAEEKVTIEILRQNAAALRNVILCHMSNSGNLNRDLAMERVKAALPDWVNVVYARAGRNYDISLCPF